MQTTKDILSYLAARYPTPLKINDFEIINVEKQNLLNKLLELEQRGLINAVFRISKRRETYGIPMDAQGIIISANGHEFMEQSKQIKNRITQNISINNSNGDLNIAGHTINLSSNIDADKIIERLLENIERSNLPDDKKKTLSESIKGMVASVSSAILIGLFNKALGG